MFAIQFMYERVFILHMLYLISKTNVQLQRPHLINQHFFIQRDKKTIRDKSVHFHFQNEKYLVLKSKTK